MKFDCFRPALRAGAVALFALTLAACAGTGNRRPAAPSYFLSAQDGRAGLEDGNGVVRSSADSLAVIEMIDGRLRLIDQLPISTSLVGPPSSIAVAPGGRLALVTAATRRDPKDASKVVTYDRVTVVALDPSGHVSPRVVSELSTGAGASGVSINREGTLALVANRVEGSVSVLAIEGLDVRQIGKVALGASAGPAHVAFTHDGKRALVSRGDNRISVLNVAGTTVNVDARVVSAGLRPYSLDISPTGRWAVVTNLGMNQGDTDTISLIDLEGGPPRVVDTVSVGQTPEGAFFSPDGRRVGVTVIDGSNKPRSSPFFGTAAYRQFEVEDGRLLRSAAIKGGSWLQGQAFSSDGRYVVVQDAAQRQLRVYLRDGQELIDTGNRLQLDGTPGAIVRWR